MEAIGVILCLVTLLALSLAVCYLDAKHNLQLVDWFNGRVKNPFERKEHNVNAQQNVDQKTIQELRARIETLEKIVTEPAYELNQKLNKL